MRRRPVDPVVAVAAVVAVVFAGLLVAGAATVEDADREVLAEDPVDALVAAWASSRRGTYRAVGTAAREGADGRVLRSEAAFVQRPPDRLVRSYGTAGGRRDDRPLECRPETGGLACGLGPRGLPFDEYVETEVASFAALVEGPNPLYVVRQRSEHCFRLTRTRYDPRSGFGVVSDLCFDPATGAVAVLDTDHGTVREVRRFDDIAPTVTDADLEP